MAERWTRERRAEQIRSVLLDAAEEVFARKGLSGAALEDIADVAGFTRGAIFQFGAKEKLFLAVVERQRQRFLDGFAEVMTSTIPLMTSTSTNSPTVARTQQRNRPSGTGYELTLLLLRNPDARERVAAQRLETIRALGDWISKNVARIGGSLNMPAETLARVVLAANDGITLDSHLDGEDLYRPYLQLIMSSIRTPSIST